MRLYVNNAGKTFVCTDAGVQDRNRSSRGAYTFVNDDVGPCLKFNHDVTEASACTSHEIIK